MKNIKVILLAGGRGERLWPQSRSNNPKPFSVSLEDGKTLFQHTLERFSFIELNNIYVCTDKKLKQKILTQAPQFFPQNIICEPMSKDTAPSVFLSTLSLKETEDVLLFAPCDHFINDQNSFQQTIKNLATTAMEKKSICLIGLPPQTPSVEFGYIEMMPSENPSSSFLVKKFHEKPDLSTAKTYLQQGNFLWNSGIFACVHRKLNEICSLYGESLYKNLQEFLVKKKSYPFEEKIERCSFDKKILEISHTLYCVQGGFDWDDVGTWNSLHKYFPTDSKGNYSNQKAVFYDSKDIFCLNTEKKLIILQGCDNLHIVNQKDILYICAKSSNGNLKEVLKILKKDHSTFL